MKRYREADVIAPKIQKPDRNWDNQQAADNRLRDLLEWLEFADNLEEAELVASAHISRESNSEPPREVASGKHSIFTHFQRPQLRGLQEKTKITRAPCRKRSGEAPLRAERFGHVTTADYTFLNEDGESRNNQRYSVVVQDLKFLRASKKSQCISSMLHRTLLDPQLSPHTCIWFVYFSSVAFLRWVHSLCKECYAVADCLNN